MMIVRRGLKLRLVFTSRPYAAAREPASRYIGDDTTSFGSLAKGNLTHAESRHHHWKHKRSDAAFEIVDIKDFNLPLLDEPVPAAMGQYSQPHTKAWAAKIELFDAFVS